MIRIFNLLTASLICAGLSSTSDAAKLNGHVKIDGSSTVFPITEAVAEEFNKLEPNVQVTVGVSGTGGGFKKFTVGETDINDASRSIKKEEAAQAATKGIKYLEVPVAYDGISIVINPKNDWAKTLSVAQLKKLWEPGSKVTKWNELNPTWPDRKIKLYGPGPDSGTFDYFTEAINGKSGACRSDFTKSEDDNMLVQGVAGDKDALGFFGFAYYVENKDKLKAVAIDNGKGAIEPSQVTINNGTYAPLSRMIFIYVSDKAGKKKEINEFVNFYIKQAASLVKEVGYVPLPKEKYIESATRFAKFTK